MGAGLSGNAGRLRDQGTHHDDEATQARVRMREQLEASAIGAVAIGAM
jgi:hypothetical protein